MSFKKNPKGVSLPLVTGLILLLFTATTAINLTVIHNLRSVQQIEASARAQSQAEAGVEDALYTLSGHLAGFETGRLTAGINGWMIQSHGQMLCRDSAGTDIPSSICGQIGTNRKVTLSFFKDTGSGTGAATIQTLYLTSFGLTFEVPTDVLAAHADPNAFAPGLVIDNDGDNAVNEDGKYDGAPSCDPGGRSFSPRDNDCDGREDEDSAEDPVVYWKIDDGAGHTLTPKPGCLGETDPDSLGKLMGGSELCEKSFSSGLLGADRLGVTLNQDAMGVREGGQDESLFDFFQSTDIASTAPLQIELLVVAPLEQADRSDATALKKIPIPALNYSVNYQANEGPIMPDPSFVIQSDGYYRDFKQSITTTITPKTSVPLTDFTLIQQE